MEHDDLAQHLESLQRENCYRVDEVLKQSSVEITQRVYFEGSNGAESGPYIRKFIKRGYGVGGAYERIYSAQQRGRRFKHIPDILECYARDDELVVIMELVRGQTLQETVYEADPSLQLARDIFPRLCDAVSELHCEFDPAIIHRDLKPSNVILTGEGLVLIDFGISREYREGAESDTTHFGTREFAPPEQYGFGQTTVRSDVYSLGMVLYFCLTEEIPSSQARERAFRDERIPESLRAVIEHAVALDPTMRYGSAAELKDAFLAAAAACAEDGANGAGERSDLRAVGAAGAAGAVGAADAAGVAGVVGATDAVDATDTADAVDGPKRASGSAAEGAKRSPWLAVGVIACLVIVAVLAFAVVGRGATGSGSGEAASSEAASSAASATSASGEPSETSTSSASPASGESDSTLEEETAAELDMGGTPRDGFDPATNFSVTVAGVDFQVPSYFKARTGEAESGAQYYYAESGSSVAMIMTTETEVNEIAEGADLDAYKDDFVNGLLDSSEAYGEVLSSTDYELAGCPARMVTVSGTIEGIPFKTKMAFYLAKDRHTLGAFGLSQTNNTLFDYSTDFAKVLASARASS